MFFINRPIMQHTNMSFNYYSKYIKETSKNKHTVVLFPPNTILHSTTEQIIRKLTVMLFGSNSGTLGFSGSGGGAGLVVSFFASCFLGAIPQEVRTATCEMRDGNEKDLGDLLYSSQSSPTALEGWASPLPFSIKGQEDTALRDETLYRAWRN